MLDSAFIATERRFLLVSDTLREIEFAKLGNGQCFLVARSSLGRVTTIGDLPEESLRFTSGRFRRPRRPVLADGDFAQGGRAAAAGAIVQYVSLCATCPGANTESFDFRILKSRLVRTAGNDEPVDRSFRDFSFH